MEFKHALSFVLKIEKGFVNDKYDPGGKTKYGISQKAYPDLDIEHLELSQAIEIYYIDYWKKAGCHEITPEYARLAVFDCAVNQGVFLAKRLWAKYDGRLDALEMFLADRALFYSTLKLFPRYGRGWMKRLFLVAMETGKIIKHGKNI